MPFCNIHLLQRQAKAQMQTCRCNAYNAARQHIMGTCTGEDILTLPRQGEKQGGWLTFLTMGSYFFLDIRERWPDREK